MADEKKLTAQDLISGMEGMSEREVIEKCEDFLKDVESVVMDEDGKVIKKPFGIVPTFSAFADYLGQPRADVHEWIRIHPTAGKQMRDMVADTIAAGSMMKAYESRIASFALKNWCGWEEAPKRSSRTSSETADEKQAREQLDAYIATERRKKFKVV